MKQAISQAEIHRLLDKAATKGTNTSEVMRRFVFECCYMTSYFKRNKIYPLSWNNETDNQLITIIHQWFNDESITKDDIKRMIIEYYQSLLPYIIVPKSELR